MEDDTIRVHEGSAEDNFMTDIRSINGRPSTIRTVFEHWLPVLLLALVIGGGFLWLSGQLQQSELRISLQAQENQRELAQTQLQETHLQSYMKNMTDLLIGNQLLRVRDRANPAKISADALTSDALSSLDAGRKARLMRFLYQVKLLSNDSTVLSLQDVDVSGAQMAGIDLRDTNLLGANLHGADMHGAILSDTILTFTNLSQTNLAKTDFHGSDMHNTNLAGANLAGANLRDVTGLTSEQLAHAQSLAGATMPDGSVHH